jgi:hypothetical protein
MHSKRKHQIFYCSDNYTSRITSTTHCSLTRVSNSFLFMMISDTHVLWAKWLYSICPFSRFPWHIIVCGRAYLASRSIGAIRYLRKHYHAWTRQITSIRLDWLLNVLSTSCDLIFESQFSRAIKYHRALGVIFWIFATLHMLLFEIKWLQSGVLVQNAWSEVLYDILSSPASCSSFLIISSSQITF